MDEIVSTFDEITTTERFIYKRSTSSIKFELDTVEFTYLNIGVLMASHLGKLGCGRHTHAYQSKWDLMNHIIHTFENTQIHTLDSPFDLERCGPAVDLALERVNDEFLKAHKIQLRKVQEG